MRLPSNGIPKFEGIDDLRRMVQAPERLLDDAALAKMSDSVEKLYDVGEQMPFGYRSRDLGSALATVHRTASEDVRAREQVRAAWEIRFGTDPAGQAAIGARIDELLTGAPATLESQRGVAELRTLLSMSTDDRHVPTALGFATTSELDDAIRTRIGAPLEKHGTLDESAAGLIHEWQLVRDPHRLAAWQASVEDAARGRGPLTEDASIELVLAPASRFAERSKAQRMRLLDALASSGDGPNTIAAARTRNPHGMAGRLSADVRLHQSRQVGRALTGEQPLPVGIHLWDVLTSWHYRRAPFADQVAVLEAHGRMTGRSIFQEYGDMRDQMDPAARLVGRRQAERVIDHAWRTGDDLPSWILARDVVLAPVTERTKAHMLSPYVGPESASTPEGAAARLINARLRINGEQMGGGVEGMLAVRSSTLDLIDRNLKRIGSDVADGYDGHPDYADVGRVETNLQLMADFQAAANGRVAREAAAASASADTLTW